MDGPQRPARGFNGLCLGGAVHGAAVPAGSAGFPSLHGDDPGTSAHLLLVALRRRQPGIPAAASWGLGFIAGATGSGYPWSRKKPRTTAPKKTKSNAKDVKEAVGSRRLLLTNAACVTVLIAGGLSHLAFQSPTAAVAAVLAGALICGWALFRFPPSALARNALVLVIPVEFFLLAFLGGNTSQPALPFVWTYGALAGILLGGHYWNGLPQGTPRPPFSSDIKRRRKRKTVRRSRDKQKPEVVSADHH